MWRFDRQHGRLERHERAEPHHCEADRDRGNGEAVVAGAAAANALGRLHAKGEIARAVRGVYYVPERSALMGAEVPAGVDEVVRAVARANRDLLDCSQVTHTIVRALKALGRGSVSDGEIGTLAPAVVEKDFWVCYTSDHLFPVGE